MKLGPFELDSVICTDAYKAIKLIPNNSGGLMTRQEINRGLYESKI